MEDIHSGILNDLNKEVFYIEQGSDEIRVTQEQVRLMITTYGLFMTSGRLEFPLVAVSEDPPSDLWHAVAFELMQKS
jgi:hypothetical protein